MDLIIPQKPKGFKKMSIVFGNGKNTNARNSRDVWKYLEAKQEFSQWFKTRINQVQAEENIDFTVVKNSVAKKGDFQRLDYIVTDDFAKHLGMLEKTQKGKEVRNYFIYMEKLARYLIEEKMKQCLIDNKKQLSRLNNQLEISRRQTQEARTGKIYKDGLMALSTYLKSRELAISLYGAFEILKDKNIVETKQVHVWRKVLTDDDFGIQKENTDVIEFDTKMLDEIFFGRVMSQQGLF